MRRLLFVLLPLCLAKGPRRPRQQEEGAPPWLTDAYLPDASKFPPAYQPNNNQRGRREATRLARADAIVHRALCKLPIQTRKEVTALTPAKFVLEAAAARGGPVLVRSVYDAAALSKWKFALASDCWLRDVCDTKEPIVRSGPAADDFSRRLPLPLFWLSAKVRFGLQKVGPCLRSKRDALLATRVSQGAGRCVAAHIRRGDKCQTYDQGQCYSTTKYAAAIQKLQSLYNYERVVVASDSPSAVAELAKLLGSFPRGKKNFTRRVDGVAVPAPSLAWRCITRATLPAPHAIDATCDSTREKARRSPRDAAGNAVESLKFDRLRVGGQENATLGLAKDEAEKLFVENRDDVDAELALVSFHADVSMLSECDAFVGTGKASVGKVALLAMIARMGVVPPFVLLDGPPRQLLRPLARIQRRVHVLKKLIASVDVTSSNDVARPRSLFDAAEVVHTFAVDDDARYASILQTSDNVYAIVKRGSLSTQKDGEVQHLSTNCDASLTCLSSSVPITSIEARNEAHNAAYFSYQDRIIAMGGRDDSRRKRRNGVYVFRDATNISSSYNPRRLVITGDHANCTERRKTHAPRCEFDGRFSVARRRDGAHLLYGRANANGVSNKRGRFGGRHVQVAVHRGDPGTKGWGPFRLIEVDGFIGGRAYENLYYGAVNAVAGYLLGLFPLSKPGRHAVVAAFSCDGIHFSRFLDVTNAGDAGAGRTFHQPVDGLIEEKGMVYAYVQENVRGLDMDRADDDPDYPTGPPRVVRYGTTLTELERRARAETRGLAGC